LSRVFCPRRTGYKANYKSTFSHVVLVSRTF